MLDMLMVMRDEEECIKISAALVTPVLGGDELSNPDMLKEEKRPA